MARRAEIEQLAQDQECKALVTAFLKLNGYDDVVAPKRTMLKTKYPIHTAAKLGDPKIVAALLEEGANPTQKTSSGQTAAQVAQQKTRMAHMPMCWLCLVAHDLIFAIHHHETNCRL